MCDCRICTEHKATQAVIESRDVDELIKVVQDLESDKAHLELDLAVKEAVMDGSWPSAKRQLTQALSNIEKTEHQKIAVLAYKIYSERGYTDDPVADWLQAEKILIMRGEICR